MLSRTALTKLQAILLIDIVIVAAAAAGFFYVQSLPGPVLSDSDIQLVDMKVTQSQILLGESVQVSVNVTNVGSEKGTYDLTLKLDGTPKQSIPLGLVSGETKTISFTISDADEGLHVIRLGNLETTFTVVSIFTFSDLAVNRTEAKIGEPIGISLLVTNRANQTGNFSLTLTINNTPVQTKTGQLDGGENTNVLFEVIEQEEGNYKFSLANLNGTFTITPSAPPPKPAEFLVANLTIDPDVAEIGASVNVSARVTNVGELTGSYNVEFTVNGDSKGSKTLQLSGGETEIVAFTISEPVKGNYTIKVGNLTGVLSVQGPSTIKLTNLIVRPYEVWAGETVSIIVKGSNTGADISSLSLRLKINDEVVQTQTVTIQAGQEGSGEFSVKAPALAAGDSLTYIVDVNGMQGGFMVVKNGYHTLNVEISPRGDADFDIKFPDGHTEQHKTFWSALLPEGTYTVVMPNQDPTGRVTFLQWDDGSTSLSRTFTLTARRTVTATYTGGSSCPSLNVWNGTQYVYVGDVSNHGWLGYTRYVNSDGSLEYWRNNPWDYIPIANSQLQAINGYFEMSLTQKWDEIFLLDSAYMLAIDHPANSNVYSTMVEQYIDPNYMGQIYTVSNNPLKPVSATNEVVTVYNGTVVAAANQTDALALISNPDGVFTSGFNGKYSEAWNNQTWNRLTLNLGNLTGASQIRLVVKAIVDWGPAESYVLWMNKFYGTKVPDHTEPTPVPFMEVKDAKGNWVRVPENRQFPLPPDGIPRTFVVDVTGLFPTNDYSLRISNFWNVTFDYVGIDIGATTENAIITRINAEANLSQQFVPVSALSSGNFTRYGNVTNLLLSEDDKFVIGRQGDSVSLKFSTNLPPIAEGMVRDYYFFVACWFKVQYANYGFGPGNDGFTVTPLPFHYMSGFPYPLQTESYPFDADHVAYLQEYNTRTILPTPS